VFNAKEYNPLTLKDVRGRSIVHAAHRSARHSPSYSQFSSFTCIIIRSILFLFFSSIKFSCKIFNNFYSMGDIVESHAYNFKKEIGYDLFAQCEAIADKLHLHRSPSPRVGDKMTELDAKYYAEILHVHQQVKDEEGDEHPTALKLLALEMQNENNALDAQEEVARCLSEQSSVDDTRDEKSRDFCTGIVGESDESQSLEDGSAEVAPTVSATATTSATATATASSSSSKSAEAEAAAAKELVDEENRIVKEELARTDIDSLPAMRSLSNALAAQKLVS
jgi:hypothetical protein